ncbi:MAG TPA: GntR family transcriptional regulator [archaeon]|nr:GntR family transcriptional regulator [archaeon]
MREMGAKIDRNASTPLYHQLAQQVRAAIERGDVLPGIFMSGEFALAKEWDVSRPTVRRVIDELINDGLVERRHGVGTVVVANEVKRSPVMTGFFADLNRDVRNPTTEVTGFARIKLDKEKAREMELPNNSEVVRVQRVRSADGRRLALLSDLLPLDVAEKISRRSLQSVGLYDLLKSEGFEPTTGFQRVGARIATASEAKRLSLEADKTVLTIHRVARNASGRVIDLSNHIYSAERYIVEMSIFSESSRKYL